jgi:hypothetical protein
MARENPRQTLQEVLKTAFVAANFLPNPPF